MARHYRAAYGSDPPPAALYGYEAMRGVLSAIRRAGRRGNDRRAVINAYLRTRVSDSVLGPYDIGSNGDSSANTYGGFEIENGQLVFERLLHGESSASSG
jgi:ABC-type branched-subunit amino acid transport system substrate-binding protein